MCKTIALHTAVIGIAIVVTYRSIYRVRVARRPRITSWVIAITLVLIICVVMTVSNNMIPVCSVGELLL